MLGLVELRTKKKTWTGCHLPLVLREVEQKKIVVLVGINAPLFQVTRYATMHVEAKVLS